MLLARVVWMLGCFVLTQLGLDHTSAAIAGALAMTGTTRLTAPAQATPAANFASLFIAVLLPLSPLGGLMRSKLI